MDSWCSIKCLKGKRKGYEPDVPRVLVRGDAINLQQLVRDLGYQGFDKVEINQHFDYPEDYEEFKHPGLFIIAEKDHKDFELQPRNINAIGSNVI